MPDRTYTFDFVDSSLTEFVLQVGEPGTDGEGVPAGGTLGQALTKASGDDYDTVWVTIPGIGVVPISLGGTEATTARGARVNLGYVTPTTLASSGSVTINLSTAANTAFEITPTGNVVLDVSGEVAGDRFVVMVYGQAGGHTITWSFVDGWAGGSPPTIPTVVGRKMLVSFYRDSGGNWNGVPSAEIY